MLPYRGRLNRQRLALRLEPGDDLLGVHAQLDDLERDAAAHGLGLLGDIDHAAAAFTDSLQQFIAPQRLADGFVGRIGEVELDRRSGAGGGMEQIGGGVVCGEQPLDALAQGIVTQARAVEEGGTLGGRLLHRGGKQGFFAGGIHRRETRFDNQRTPLEFFIMEITLPRALQKFVESKVRSGGYADASEVVCEALRNFHAKEDPAEQDSRELAELLLPAVAGSHRIVTATDFDQLHQRARHQPAQA